MTFAQWLQAVDRAVADMAFGLSLFDLPNIDYRSLYESGEPPRLAAEEALAGADFPFADLGLEGER